MTINMLHNARQSVVSSVSGRRHIAHWMLAFVIGFGALSARAAAEVRHALIEAPTLVTVELETDYLPYDLCFSDHANEARRIVSELAAGQISDPGQLYVISLPQAPARFSIPSLDGARDLNGDLIPERSVSRTRRNYEDALDEALLDILTGVREARPGAMLSIEGVRDIKNRNRVRFAESGAALDFIYFDKDLMRRVPRSRRSADMSRILRSLTRWLEQNGMNENHFMVLRARDQWIAAGVGSEAPIESFSEEELEEIANAWVDEDPGDGPEIAVGEQPPAPSERQQPVASAHLQAPSESGQPAQQQMRAAAKSPDLNGDGRVNAEDSAILLGLWGSNNADADLDSSGKVGSDDLAILIGHFSESSAPAAVAGEFRPFLNRYFQGSGQGVEFSMTEGGGPEVLVVFQVWSHDLGRAEMAFEDREAPFEYPSALFDLVSPGPAQLQAIVKNYAQETLSTFVLDLEVVANEEQIAGGDDPERPISGAEPRAVIEVMDTTTQRMAPHTVHVHATSSNLGSPEYMWQRATIEWDFGDRSGQRQTTTDPRSGRIVDLSSEQVGFNAAYIYRVPGTYTITMRITNEMGLSHSTSKTVTIHPDARSKRYVDGVSGSDSNSGSSPSDAWRTISHAIENLQSDSSLYLKRGQVFGASERLQVGRVKNVYIGEYGPGSGKPIVRWLGSPERGTFWQHSAHGENIMVENLVFQTTYGFDDEVNGVRALEPNAKMSTIVNCEFRGKDVNDAFSRVISTTSGVTGVLAQNIYSSKVNGRAMPFRGSDHCYIGVVIDGGSKLLMRGGFSGMDRLNSSWCSFIKGDFGGGGVRYGRVQWGYLYQSLLHEGVNDIGHDDADTDYIVIDGCIFDDPPGGLGSVIVHHNAQNLMMRNNVFINDEDYRATMKAKTSSTFSGLYGLENFDILNNTFIVRDRSKHSTIIDLRNADYEITNVRICNNLFATPASFNQEFIRMDSFDGLTEAVNNVYPDLGNAHAYFEIAGAAVTWQPWDTSPKTENEARESVNQSELRAPTFGLGGSHYPISSSNGRPVPGVVADFHGQAREAAGRSSWTVGAVDGSERD